MLEIRWINFNMGCIETVKGVWNAETDYRLTLTWDVLKLTWLLITRLHIMINFNMGCIETQCCLLQLLLHVQINFNMGCIETCTSRPTVLWQYQINFNMGCIETRGDGVKVEYKGLD